MNYKERITPHFINKLKPNEVFVFGSNIMGRHGKGAAKDAMKFGAKYGKGEGLHGQTYALPTKGEDLRKSLSLEEIEKSIDKFKECVEKNKGKKFLVTPVGCGLAGYDEKDIAPLFKCFINNNEVFLPNGFWEVLKKYTSSNEENKL